jgi:hypothetical protein
MKFDRQALQGLLFEGEALVGVTGRLLDGRRLVATDTVRVID